VATPSPRSAFPPPPGARLETPAHSVISPSGARLAFAATDSAGHDWLWVRSLATGRARRLAGTEGARFPFWSPDDRAIGYFAHGKLRAIAPDGSGARVIAGAPEGYGGAWSRGGTIVFAPDEAGPIWRVRTRGGRATRLTRIETELDSSDHRESVEEERAEPAHRAPCFLPDGKHFLYQEYPDEEGLYRVLLGSIDGGEPRPVLLASSSALYAPPGYLIYSRMQVLVAQKWDPAHMEVTGAPVPLSEVAADPGVDGAPRVSISASGALAYSNQASVAGLEWVDPAGKSLGRVPLEPGPYEGVALSPDGRRAVLVRFVSPGDTDLWLVDLGKGIGARFTHEKGMERAPRWLPDGSRVVFRSNRDGRWRSYSKAADNSESEQVLASGDVAGRTGASQVTTGGRTLRLVALPQRGAGHTVIRDWTTLLPR